MCNKKIQYRVTEVNSTTKLLPIAVYSSTSNGHQQLRTQVQTAHVQKRPVFWTSQFWVTPTVGWAENTRWTSIIAAGGSEVLQFGNDPVQSQQRQKKRKNVPAKNVKVHGVVQ